MADYNGYTNYVALTNFLQNTAAGSNLTRLFTIGKSVNGRELWVIEIAAKVRLSPPPLCY